MAKQKKNDKRLYVALLIISSLGLGLNISDYLAGDLSWQTVVGSLVQIGMIASTVYMILLYKQK